MKTIKQAAAFFLPAATAAYLYLAPKVAEHGVGNIPTSTGIFAAGIAFTTGAVCIFIYLKLARR